MGADIALRVEGGRLERLYVDHIDHAVRLAFLMTGDRQAAQDIAQDAFVKIAGRFQSLRSPEAFPGYLRTTVLNLSRGHLRRLKTQRTYVQRQRSARGPEAYGPDVGSRDEMWRALQPLPHRQRAALVLRYYEDLSEEQAADALGVSKAALKSLVTRGLNELRQQMRGEADE